jgi:4-nitrophenyl phosphatase
MIYFDFPPDCLKEKTVIFVTNAAALSRKELKAKLNGLGIKVDMVREMLPPLKTGLTLFLAEKDEIYSSAYASAVYISSIMKLPKDQKVYVIGMSGIEEELREAGVSFIGGMASIIAAMYALFI